MFYRVCSDRARGNGLKLKEGRYRSDERFFTVREVEQVVQRDGGCPIPGSAQGQVAQGSE